jgi:hypothetical protein
LEYTVGGVFDARVVSTIGYRPFNRTLDDVESLRQNLNNNEVLVFKMKANLAQKLPIRLAGPVGDMLDWSWYHEVLIGVADDRVFFGDFTDKGAALYFRSIGPTGLSRSNGFTDGENRLFGGMKKKSFQYMGKANRHEFVQNQRTNVLGVERRMDNINAVTDPKTYRFFRQNCQHYVTGIVKSLTTLTR